MYPSPLADGVIDSHQHFADVARFRYRWMTPERALICRSFLPEELRPLLQRNGVHRTVVVQAHESLEEARFLLSMARGYEFVGAVVPWVDLTASNLADVLDDLARDPKVRGVRYLWQGTEDDWLAKPEVLRGLGELAARDLAFDLAVRTQHLRFIWRVAERYPTLRLVADHMAMPPIASGALEPWATELAAVAPIPHLFCKLSGGFLLQVNRQRWQVADLVPFVRFAVERFGFQRCMWGSDWPVSSLAATYDQVLKSVLQAVGPAGPDELRRLFSETARSFYKIDA